MALAALGLLGIPSRLPRSWIVFGEGRGQEVARALDGHGSGDICRGWCAGNGVSQWRRASWPLAWRANEERGRSGVRRGRMLIHSLLPWSHYFFFTPSLLLPRPSPPTLSTLVSHLSWSPPKATNGTAGSSKPMFFSSWKVMPSRPQCDWKPTRRQRPLHMDGATSWRTTVEPWTYLVLMARGHCS